MTKPMSLALTVCSVLLSYHSYAAAEGELTESGTVYLIYTDLDETTQLMRDLPFINSTDHDIEIESWGYGNPCGQGSERLEQAVAYSEEYVFTHCNRELLDHPTFRPIPIDFITPGDTPNLHHIVEGGAFDDFIDGDNLIAIPGLSVFMVLPRYLPVFREDWLDAIGFELSTTDRIPLEPSGVVSFVDHTITVDELHDILVAIKEHKLLPPNVAPVAAGRWRYNWPTLFGAFGLSTVGESEGTKVTVNGIPNTEDRETSALLPNVMTSQYQALAATIAQWYSEGLLDREVLTSDRGWHELLQLLIVGRAATILSFPAVIDWDSIVTQAREASTLSDSTRIVVLPPPIGHGQGTHILRTSSANGTFLAMTTHASDDDVKAALGILEFVKLTREGFVLEHHGVDGTEDQPPHFPRYPYYRLPHMYPVMYPETTVELLNRLTSNEAWALKPTYWIGPQGSTQMRDAYEGHSDLNAAIDEFFTKIVTGQVSIHDFPDFRADLRDMGILEALAVTMAQGELTRSRTPPRWPTETWEPLLASDG